MQNQSTEDYIKSIYKLKSKGKTVTTSALAKQLQIGDGSVTDMVKKLSEKKLLRYTPYQGVDLTEEGNKLAMKMMRRHRLWEMFLVKFLHFRWDEVHDEAERLEHVTSDELEKRLDKALDYPKVDPHGDPIPSSSGELKELKYVSLDTCDIGKRYVIVRASDDNPEVLQHATKLGLELNKKIVVKERTSFDKSMLVRIGQKEHFISQRLAEAIFVLPVTERR
jgi:DtxR family Mn-dependent transcriptional regulator